MPRVERFNRTEIAELIREALTARGQNIGEIIVTAAWGNLPTVYANAVILPGLPGTPAPAEPAIVAPTPDPEPWAINPHGCAGCGTQMPASGAVVRVYCDECAANPPAAVRIIPPAIGEPIRVFPPKRNAEGGRSIGALKSSGFCAANEEPPQ